MTYWGGLEENKQETLEEAILNNLIKSFGKDFDLEPRDIIESCNNSFIEGAKWQKEQDKKLYNEEEVHAIIESYQNNVENNPNHITYDKWFEKLKKK